MTADDRARITTVTFDLGGVLIDWDPRYLYRTLFDDEAEMEAFLAEVTTPAWNAEQDAGRPWVDAVDALAAEFPEHRALIEAYRQRWAETLGDAIQGTVDVLAELRDAGVRLLALSNWSAETFPVALERYPFLGWFEGIVISGEVGAAKPDERIFRVLIERHAIEPAETVFVDDTVANVEAAEGLGFIGLRFHDPDRLRTDLERLGVLGPSATTITRYEGDLMDWIDVSVPLRDEMTVFTGEPPFRRERISAIADGAICNISRMALGVHTGTHVDAPIHFVEGGATAEAIALDALIGPAWVVDATAATGSITAGDLDGFDIPADEVRLLFRTRTAHLWDSPAFEPGFVALDATAATALVRRGVRSVGIDYLSIAPFGDPVATHRILFEAGVVVLEGLDLRTVAPGAYDLLCLPLRIVGSDGAPARALLRPRG